MTGRLLLGTVPGVVIGSVMRVYAAPGVSGLAAAVLFAVGNAAVHGSRHACPAGLDQRSGFGRGGSRGRRGGRNLWVGGGSLLGPLLVGAGLSVARQRPQACPVDEERPGATAAVGALPVAGFERSGS